MLPSVKTIAQIEWLDKIGDPVAIAKQIRKILEFNDKADLLEYCEDTLDLNWQSANMGARGYSLIDVKLWICDRVLECHGIETIRPINSYTPYTTQDCHLAYCNVGDAYVTTIAYDYTRDRFVITSYGDWIEKNDPSFEKY